jgi:hypothetical protein
MIEGSFKDVSLPALLHLLCFETAKSFRVTITDENQNGFIAIRRGWVVAAQFGLLEGEDAVCEFQSWSNGSFHAQQVAPQQDSEKNLRFDFQPNSGFINDCAILNEHHIGLNSELTGSRLFGSAEWKGLVQEHPLDRECFSVLAWLREGRKMRQALREFGFDIVRATAILAMLIRTRSVEVIRPGLGSFDHHNEYSPEKPVPTTGGQQEAAAALARKAARELESVTDVAEEAFMSTSFKSPEFTESKANHRAITFDPQTSSYSLDTQSRSSIEARLRAKKNSDVASGSDLQPASDKVTGKVLSQNQARQNPAISSSNLPNPTSQPKKAKPDLFSVLQSRTGKVVPDLGTSTPPTNTGQVTASTHNLPTLKQARLNADKPELLKPEYHNQPPGESANINTIRKEVANSSESSGEDLSAASSDSWSGPSEPSPMSVNWPKNVPSNTFQNMPAQQRSEPVPVRTTPVDSETHLTPVDASSKSADVAPSSTPTAPPAQPPVQSLPQPVSQPASPPAPPLASSPSAQRVEPRDHQVDMSQQTPTQPRTPPTASSSTPPPTPGPSPSLSPTSTRTPTSRVSTDLMTDNDPRLVAKTDAMPLVAFDIERLLLTTFLATQFGKLALGNPSLDLHRRQTLMDAEYGKCLAVSIEDNTRLPSAVLSSYRYCLERGYIETHDPVIPLTADLLLGRMEIDQYLLQRRRITGDELRDLVKVAREEGIKLTQLLVRSGYLTEADLETLGREQKRFAFK